MNVPFLTSEQQAQSCWALANGYYAGAVRLLGGGGEIFLPTLLLLLHALELHLKAFLLSRGVTDKQLRSISHDLLKCLRECHKHGLSKYVRLSWREQMQIARVNRYYKNKELEYFVPRAKSFGCVQDLVDAVGQVSRGVFSPITETTFRALVQAN